MKKLKGPAKITKDLRQRLNKFPVDARPVRWYGRSKAVLRFKKEIMKQGLVIQSDRCAWCMLSVGPEGHRTAHRDHIVASSDQPKWTFLPKNLVIACEYCNGLAVKKDSKTVSVLESNYDRCEFSIVHPYLDNPSLHIKFECDAGETEIVIKSITQKGEDTITMMKLDNPQMTMLRAKEYIFDKHRKKLNPQYQALFVDALKSMGISAT